MEATPVTGEMDSSEVCCFLCSNHLKHTKGKLSFYEDTLLKKTFGSNNLGFWGREKHEALPFLPHAYASIDNGRNSQLRPLKEKWSSLHNAASLFADKRVRSTRSEADKEILNNFTTRCEHADKISYGCTHTHTHADGDGCTSRGTPQQQQRASDGSLGDAGAGERLHKAHGDRRGNHHPDRKEYKK